MHDVLSSQLHHLFMVWYLIYVAVLISLAPMWHDTLVYCFCTDKSLYMCLFTYLCYWFYLLNLYFKKHKSVVHSYVDIVK